MRRIVLTLAAAASVLALSGPATAGSLRVSPVGLDLPAGRAAATLTLRNDDATPMNVQVRLFRWTQGPEGDRYEPTTDVVISPPIAPLAPNSERVVRVVRTAPDSDREASYRIIVDELPPPPGTQGREVRLLMRHSIPVFFTPPGSHAPKVTWAARTDDGKITVRAANRGGRRLRVANVRLIGADGAVLAQHPGLIGYVLAGAECDWTILMERSGGGVPARLLADTDAGPLDAPLGSPL